MVPPEPPAGAAADDPALDDEPPAELPAAPAGALELTDDEDGAVADDELDADAPAVLDEEQAASEPATAIAMHAVMTEPRVVEE